MTIFSTHNATKFGTNFKGKSFKQIKDEETICDLFKNFNLKDKYEYKEQTVIDFKTNIKRDNNFILQELNYIYERIFKSKFKQILNQVNDFNLLFKLKQLFNKATIRFKNVSFHVYNDLTCSNPMLIFTINDDNIYINNIYKGIYSGTEILIKIKEFARNNNYNTLELEDQSCIEFENSYISLSTMFLANKGQSWYNKYGFISYTYEQTKVKWNEFKDKPLHLLLELDEIKSEYKYFVKNRYGNTKINNQIKTNGLKTIKKLFNRYLPNSLNMNIVEISNYILVKSKTDTSFNFKFCNLVFIFQILIEFLFEYDNELRCKLD